MGTPLPGLAQFQLPVPDARDPQPITKRVTLFLHKCEQPPSNGGRKACPGRSVGPVDCLVAVS